MSPKKRTHIDNRPSWDRQSRPTDTEEYTEHNHDDPDDWLIDPNDQFFTGITDSGGGSSGGASASTGDNDRGGSETSAENEVIAAQFAKDYPGYESAKKNPWFRKMYNQWVYEAEENILGTRNKLMGIQKKIDEKIPLKDEELWFAMLSPADRYKFIHEAITPFTPPDEIHQGPERSVWEALATTALPILIGGAAGGAAGAIAAGAGVSANEFVKGMRAGEAADDKPNYEDPLQGQTAGIRPGTPDAQGSTGNSGSASDGTFKPEDEIQHTPFTPPTPIDTSGSQDLANRSRNLANYLQTTQAGPAVNAQFAPGVLSPEQEEFLRKNYPQMLPGYTAPNTQNLAQVIQPPPGLPAPSATPVDPNYRQKAELAFDRNTQASDLRQREALVLPAGDMRQRTNTPPTLNNTRQNISSLAESSPTTSTKQSALTGNNGVSNRSNLGNQLVNDQGVSTVRQGLTGTSGDNFAPQGKNNGYRLDTPSSTAAGQANKEGRKAVAPGTAPHDPREPNPMYPDTPYNPNYDPNNPSSGGKEPFKPPTDSTNNPSTTQPLDYKRNDFTIQAPQLYGSNAASYDELIKSYKDVASGVGPSAGTEALKAGMQKSRENLNSLAASTVGMNPALKAKSFLGAQRSMEGDITQQAGVMRAQEALAAQQGWGATVQNKTMAGAKFQEMLNTLGIEGAKNMLQDQSLKDNLTLGMSNVERQALADILHSGEVTMQEGTKSQLGNRELDISEFNAGTNRMNAGTSATGVANAYDLAKAALSKQDTNAIIGAIIAGTVTMIKYAADLLGKTPDEIKAMSPADLKAALDIELPSITTTQTDSSGNVLIPGDPGYVPPTGSTGGGGEATPTGDSTPAGSRRS